MKLKEICSLIPFSQLIGHDCEIAGVTIDSRMAAPGDLFIHMSGDTLDGRNIVMDAVSRGVSAIVTEALMVNTAVPQLIVKDIHYAMRKISAYYYNDPSAKLKIIGITGTNGKTTTSFLIEYIFNEYRYKTALMGTIGIKMGPNVEVKSGYMYESIYMQRYLNEMVQQDYQYCILEVTAGGLYKGKIIGTDIHTAIFTNLSPDHLDYMETMEKYLLMKSSLFSRMGNSFEANENKYAILNLDDPASEVIKKITAAQVIGYGINSANADVSASHIISSTTGTTFKLHAFGYVKEVSMKLIGTFNVYNALAAISAGIAHSIPIDFIINSISNFNFVPGRMELIRSQGQFDVILDYAHTPDGLENVLLTLNELKKGKIVTVFGCGGDRDKTKRPVMGKIAAQYSDLVIVTSDNPRNENPDRIICDIMEGIPNEKLSNCIRITDRKCAIEKALGMAQSDDIVLVAGKGHEEYQLVNGKKYPLSDRNIILQSWQSIRG